jgi:hypothetical protein
MPMTSEAREEVEMSHSFVISTQNKAYCGWMAMLFAFSIRRVRDASPIIMAVHGSSAVPLEPEFRLLEAVAGARVIRAIEYEHLHPGISYVPWNSAGSLIHAAYELDTDLAVMCDADFVMLEKVDFGGFDVTPGRMTMDQCGYMVTSEGRREADLDVALARAGVSIEELDARRWGSVPYVIHRDDAMRYGRKWRDMIHHFAVNGSIHWIAVMWAAVLAARRLDLQVKETRLAATNWNDIKLSKHPWPIVHYGHGGQNFDKRRFCFPVEQTRTLWDLRPTGDGTVDDRIRLEIEAAARFYEIDTVERRQRLLG